MEDIKKLEDAFLNAHQSGNKEYAKMFSDEIKRINNSQKEADKIEPTINKKEQINTEKEDDSIFDKVVDSVYKNNIGSKLGQIIVEKYFKEFEPEIYQANREGVAADNWNKKIRESDLKLNSISDKRSQEYQNAFEEHQNNIQNKELDVKGEYVKPSPDVSIKEIVSMATDSPLTFIGGMAEQLINNPIYATIPAGYMRAASATYNTAKALKLSQSIAGASKVIGGAVGVGAISSVSASAENVLNQKVNNPNLPIDMSQVAKEAVNAGLIGMALTGVGVSAVRSVKLGSNAVSKKVNQATAKQVQLEAQKIWLQKKESGKEISKALAIRKSFGKFDNKMKSREYLIPMKQFMDEDAIKVAVSNSKNNKTFNQKIVEGALKTSRETNRIWNEVTQPIISTLRDLGQLEIATELDAADLKLSTQMQERLAIKDKFSKLSVKLDDNDKSLLNLHLRNKTINEFKKTDNGKRIITKELDASLSDVSKLLTSMYDDLKLNGVDINRVDDYFPSSVRYEDMAKDRGLSLSLTKKVLVEKLNKKLNLTGDKALRSSNIGDTEIRSALSNKEITDAILDAIKINKKQPSILNSSTQSRVTDTIATNDIRFYKDPEQALTDYIIQNTTKARDLEFFGAKLNKSIKSNLDNTLKEDDLYKSNIDDYVNRMVSKGVLDFDDIDKVIGLLKSRFINGKQRPNKIVGNAKNIMYSVILGNPISASTQLGDIGSSVYINSAKSTSKAIIDRINPNKETITMEDFGLDALTHEMEHLPFTAKALDWSLKASGFKTVDRLGKEVTLNATHNLLTSKAKSKIGKEYFNKRFGGRLTNKEINNIYNGFKDGGDKNNPHVRLALFSELTKIQPISMSQMPKMYLDHPNGRIAYMLKTFMLKQLDLARNDIYGTMSQGISKINSGDKSGKKQVLESFYNLSKMAATIGLANATIEEVKKTFKGEEFDLTSSDIGLNLIKNWGANEYLIKKISNGQFVDAGLTMVMPPLNSLDIGSRLLLDKNYKFDDARIVGGIFDGLFMSDNKENDFSLNYEINTGDYK